MITKSKKALLHLAKARLQMEDADYRALLRRAAGVQSSVDLDNRGFDAVMQEFERLGFRATRAKVARSQNRQGGDMASPAQIGKILSLWRQFTGRDDDLALGRWLEKHQGVSHLRFLNRRRASACVAILDKMVAWKRSRPQDGSPPVPKDAA